MYHTFTRAAGIPNKPLISSYSITRGPVPPERPPSNLPPPANMSLALSLGPKIGHGRSGVVFEASIDFQSSSREVASFAIPPLVVKISRAGHCNDLRHEAFYYEEMESIQGVIVPRYYCLFETWYTSPGCFVSVTDDQVAYDLLQNDSPDDRDSDSSFDSDSSDEYDEDSLLELDTSSHTIQQLYKENFVNSSCPPVCIIVMERLGDKLPIGQPLRDDIVYVCSAHIQMKTL